MRNSILIILLVIPTTYFALWARAAQVQGGVNMASLVDMTVREVKTSETLEFFYRAISGNADQSEYLVIEKISKNKAKSAPDKLVSTWHVQDLSGGKNVKLRDGWRIFDLTWNASGLQFKNQSFSGSLMTSVDCEIKAYDKDPSVQCK